MKGKKIGTSEPKASPKSAPEIPFKMLLKILVALVIVSTYTFLTLSPKTAEPLTSAVSDVVLAITGYTALPLHSISASPSPIPPLSIAEDFAGAGRRINATQQLSIYAIYKSTTDITGVARLKEVTDKAIYQSSNEKIATVTTGGLVQAVASGSANITVSYTAAPGSTNLSAVSEGKLPITVSVKILVRVR